PLFCLIRFGRNGARRTHLGHPGERNSIRARILGRRRRQVKLVLEKRELNAEARRAQRRHRNARTGSRRGKRKNETRNGRDQNENLQTGGNRADEDCVSQVEWVGTRLSQMEWSAAHPAVWGCAGAKPQGHRMAVIFTSATSSARPCRHSGRTSCAVF